MKLTQLVVVGEAKSIDVSLTRDGEGEIRPAESVLEAHFASSPSASDRDKLGDQHPFWGRRQGVMQGLRIYALPASKDLAHRMDVTDYT